MTPKHGKGASNLQLDDDNKIQRKHLEQMAQDFEPPRENSFRQRSPSVDSNKTLDQTGVSYSYVMAGGKKKKKKKKKKSKK